MVRDSTPRQAKGVANPEAQDVQPVGEDEYSASADLVLGASGPRRAELELQEVGRQGGGRIGGEAESPAARGAAGVRARAGEAAIGE
jgi:hypothetical protein